MLRRPGLLAFACLLAPLFSSADEGMWPFPSAPVERIRQATGVSVTPQWLEKARGAAVRVNDAGSGSFISRDGLILTNHHVIDNVLDKLSKPQKDLIVEGFRAQSAADEIKVPVEVLSASSITDVTARVVAAMDKATEPAKAVSARDAEIEAIEAGAGGDKAEVSRAGDRWLLTIFKSYSDVRLVFAPPAQAAYFGFHDDRAPEPSAMLDMALLRVYGEDGKPMSSPNFYPLDATGGQDGEAVFAAGFPYQTHRQLTEAQMKLERRFVIGEYAERGAALKQAYDAYAALGTTEAREVLLRRMYAADADDIGRDMLDLSSRPEFWAGRRERDARLQAAVAADPALRREYGSLFADIEDLQRRKEARYAETVYRGLAPESGLAEIARAMLRYAEEAEKPEAERGEDLGELRAEILDIPAPSLRLEERVLSATLDLSRRMLGDDDAFVDAALGGASPAEAARRIVTTTLGDPEARKRLLDQGAAAIRTAADPLLELARRAEPHAEAAQKWYEENIEPEEKWQTWMMARLNAAVNELGPEPNWALRLSYGRVRGYHDGARQVPAHSTLGQVYALHDAAPSDPDFAIDPLLLAARGSVNGSAPLNGLADTDITGGNSGSGMFNGRQELVGLVFATNLHGNMLDYDYTPQRGRTVFVDARGIMEALRNGYGMTRIADEIARDAAALLARPPAAPAPGPCGHRRPGCS